MGILINDYINGENSVCRDEVQFSVYLFQLLNGCKRVKIDSENYANKNYEVFRAYFKPAFLRDYFNCADDKADFNLRLLTFANRKLRALYAGEEAEGVMIETISVKDASPNEFYDIDKELNREDLPFDAGKHINGWNGAEREFRNPIARWMMNVRPDIAVLLKRRGIKRTELRMHYVDCRYLDGVDTYPAIVGRMDADGKKVKSCKRIVCTKQQIERWALEFLCETPSEEYTDTLGLQLWGQAKESDTPVEESAIAIEPGFVSLACLVGKKNESMYSEEEKTISMQKLQEYHASFFCEERKAKEPKVVLGSAVDVQF